MAEYLTLIFVIRFFKVSLIKLAVLLAEAALNTGWAENHQLLATYCQKKNEAGI